METNPQPEPQPSNNGWLIGVGGIVAVILLCCCCAVMVIALVTVMGPAVGSVFSSINNSLLTPEMPANFPTLPADFPTPDLSDIPTLSADLSELIPQGGRGDEVLRASAWAYVVIAASLDGCSASQAADTTIDVTQEPDSDGKWEEKWTVKCDDGSTKAYNVAFTPSDGGGTDINVTSAK